MVGMQKPLDQQESAKEQVLGEQMLQRAELMVQDLAEVVVIAVDLEMDREGTDGFVEDFDEALTERVQRFVRDARNVARLQHRKQKILRVLQPRLSII